MSNCGQPNSELNYSVFGCNSSTGATVTISIQQPLTINTTITSNDCCDNTINISLESIRTTDNFDIIDVCGIVLNGSDMLTGVATGSNNNDNIATQGYVDDHGGGGSGDVYIRTSDFVSSAFTSYQGYAISGSSQSDPVWVITKIVSNLSGSIVSSNQYFNQSWTNRYLL